MTRRARTFLLLSSLFTSIAHAGPNEHITLYGVGTNSCGSFLEATKGKSTGIVERETGRIFSSSRYVYSQWVSGYVTAYNVLNYGKTGVKMVNNDTDGLMAWITSYCQKNPLHVLERAVNALIQSHVVERRD